MSTSGRRVVRLTPRTRAALGMRLAERRHPARTSLGQVVVSGLLILVVAVAAIGGSAAIVGSSVVAALASGLPDLADLDHLTFSQPTVIYDRTGKIALARFEQQDRRVVAYADVPPLVVDATTAAEDRTFWVNDGWDPAAIAAAAFQNLGGGRDERGASTITQQLVRARLLPTSVTTSGDRYLRKALEIIQSARLTDAFPGDAGKEKIIAERSERPAATRRGEDRDRRQPS